MPYRHTLHTSDNQLVLGWTGIEFEHVSSLPIACCYVRFSRMLEECKQMLGMWELFLYLYMLAGTRAENYSALSTTSDSHKASNPITRMIQLIHNPA